MRLVQYGPDNDPAGGLKRTVIAESETSDVLKEAADNIAYQYGYSEPVWPQLLAEMPSGRLLVIKPHVLYLTLVQSGTPC